MDKIKFWGMAVGFILFLWVLSPSPPSQNVQYDVAPAPEEAAATAPSTFSTSGGAPSATPLPADPGTPVTFRPEKIRIQTARGVLPLMAGIADNDFLLRQGLMHYRIWPQNIHGVLFLFATEAPLSMWMKNTYIPLDMVFINATGTVVHVAENTTPLSEAMVISPHPARAVFEIPAGSAKKWQISVGSTFVHPFFSAQ